MIWSQRLSGTRLGMMIDEDSDDDEARELLGQGARTQ